MMHLLFAMCVAVATSRQVPVGLDTSARDSSEPLISVVVADIDRDGDADVIATDAALHLFVWLNDGTGRFTQQQPASGGERSADGDRPGVGPGLPIADPSAPTDPLTMAPRDAASVAVPRRASGLARCAVDVPGDAPLSTRALRGPPVGRPQL